MTRTLLGRQLSKEYNCAHYVAEAWERETGQDIRAILAGFLLPPTQRRAMPHVAHQLKRIHRPEGPCIVLFRRVKSAPHVGFFIRGRVAHLADTGPIRQLLDVASIGYTSVRFYALR